MAKFSFFVFTNARAGRESEFNAWYDDVHLAEMLRIDGVVAAHRFQAVQAKETSPPWRYLTVYEWDAASPAAAREALQAARATGAVSVSEDLDRSNTAAWFYEPIR